jgi:hypothetical protein
MVNTTCITGHGFQCNKIPAPQRVCTLGKTINVLEFRYLSQSPCSKSTNNQGGDAKCTDFAPMPAGPAVIQCVNKADGSSLSVRPAIVTDGGVFSVTNSIGALPTAITCTIFNEKGTALQANTINTSGNDALSLNDRFGGMSVFTCDQVTCLEKLNYFYTVDNSGKSALRLTQFNQSFNGIGTDLFPTIPLKFLNPGQNFVYQSADTFIDLCPCPCNPGTYTNIVNVAGNPQTGGNQCMSSATYNFHIAGF